MDIEKVRVLFDAYLICYAIGYILWVKPKLTLALNDDKKREWDIAFYLSLFVFCTINYILSS